MIVNPIMSAIKEMVSKTKTSNLKNARRQYIKDKYHERSIVYRYFK